MGYRTQDLIFTLYGDYLTSRGGEAWIGHIIELMDELNTSAQAVRSTLSRMTRKGWLSSRREGRHSYYKLTPKAEALVAEGTQRIYQPRRDPWDRRWHILTYSIPEDRRHLRHRLTQRLIWLGFGRLGTGVWISPHDRQQEITQVGNALGLSGQIDLFVGEYLGPAQAAKLADRCWDLQQLNQAYLDFVGHHRPAWRQLATQSNKDSISPRAAFVQRFLLVHEYRSFPYIDPNLPPELLPDDWMGEEAEQLFQSYAALLRPIAHAYVDTVLDTAPAG